MVSLPFGAHWTKTVTENPAKLDVKRLPAKFKRLISFFTLSILCCTQFQTCASAPDSQFPPNFHRRARYPGFVNRCAASRRNDSCPRGAGSLTARPVRGNANVCCAVVDAEEGARPYIGRGSVGLASQLTRVKQVAKNTVARRGKWTNGDRFSLW